MEIEYIAVGVLFERTAETSAFFAKAEAILKFFGVLQNPIQE